MIDPLCNLFYNTNERKSIATEVDLLYNNRVPQIAQGIFHSLCTASVISLIHYKIFEQG